MNQQDFDEKSWQYTEKKNNEKELQQAYKDNLGAQVNEAGTRFVNAYTNNLEATAKYNAIIDKKNKANYEAALDRKAQNDIRMFNDQNSQTNLDNRYNQQQWTNQQSQAEAERKRKLSRIQDQATFANEVEKATKAIDQFSGRFGMAPPSSINPAAPNSATGEPGIIHWP